MRKQFLYVNKAGFHYAGPGNIDIGPGSRGTVHFWFHPAQEYPSCNRYGQRVGQQQLSAVWRVRGGEHGVRVPFRGDGVVSDVAQLPLGGTGILDARFHLHVGLHDARGRASCGCM